MAPSGERENIHMQVPSFLLNNSFKVWTWTSCDGICVNSITIYGLVTILDSLLMAMNKADLIAKGSQINSSPSFLQGSSFFG